MSLKTSFYNLFQTKIAILESMEDNKDDFGVVFHARIREKNKMCAHCSSRNVRCEGSKQRKFRGCNLGNKKTYMKLTTCDEEYFILKLYHLHTTEHAVIGTIA